MYKDKNRNTNNGIHKPYLKMGTSLCKEIRLYFVA